jgi:hypothetical protein
MKEIKIKNLKQKIYLSFQEETIVGPVYDLEMRVY